MLRFRQEKKRTSIATAIIKTEEGQGFGEPLTTSTLPFDRSGQSTSFKKQHTYSNVVSGWDS